ncbi:Aspartate aminotransferase [Pyrodictium delaneyi]|uniref:Aminotransferase n=1 Tax=Pyrodictium delaneyi TaxID=1273541 RepID=A0A0P0N1E1_9CREN|nr:aminotransferase class I/II-fold pyridoxal phosphate-dependent enzyme [Pyrodictium delaneyi]ALL00371.1 Aspartate aminotransferase [Pyrodictium delaneyi]
MRLLDPYSGEAIPGLPRFCLERWQSLHETRARVLLSESGVEPLTLHELRERYGLDLGLDGVELGYGWTQGSPELREAVAGLYEGAGPENVLATCGSAEANLLAVAALVKPGDTVVVDMPNYMQVWGLLRLRGARVLEAWRSPANGWKLPVDRLVHLIEEHRPSAVFITNPNNPTGSAAYERELGELAEAAARRGTILVFDEVYRGLEHGTGRRVPSIVEVAGLSQAVATSGLSKVYGLPGLRVGWLVADQKTIERAWSVKDYTTIAIPVLSDHIASRVLGSPEVRAALEERARRIVAANLEALRGMLEEQGHQGLLEPYWPSAGAYLLARVPWARGTMELAERLFEVYGILVNPGECFMLPGTLRIGLGADPARFPKAARELLEALQSLQRETAPS